MIYFCHGVFPPFPLTAADCSDWKDTPSSIPASSIATALDVGSIMTVLGDVLSPGLVGSSATTSVVVTE